MIDANGFIKVLNKLQLSAEHYCFAHFILLNKEEKKDKTFNYDFGSYCEINKDAHDYRKIIDDLEDKGYLINNNNHNEVYKFDKITVTSKFKDIIFIEKEQAWTEVLTAYPKKMWIGNSERPANTFDSFLKKEYYDNVTKGGNKELHKYFIECVKLYYPDESSVRERGLGLKKFIESWEGLKLTIQDAIDDKGNVVYKKLLK